MRCRVPATHPDSLPAVIYIRFAAGLHTLMLCYIDDFGVLTD